MNIDDILEAIIYLSIYIYILTIFVYTLIYIYNTNGYICKFIYVMYDVITDINRLLLF